MKTTKNFIGETENQGKSLKVMDKLSTTVNFNEEKQKNENHKYQNHRVVYTSNANANANAKYKLTISMMWKIMNVKAYTKRLFVLKIFAITCQHMRILFSCVHKIMITSGCKWFLFFFGTKVETV